MIEPELASGVVNHVHGWLAEGNDGDGSEGVSSNAFSF